MGAAAGVEGGELDGGGGGVGGGGVVGGEYEFLKRWD